METSAPIRDAINNIKSQNRAADRIFICVACGSMIKPGPILAATPLPATRSHTTCPKAARVTLRRHYFFAVSLVPFWVPLFTCPAVVLVKYHDNNRDVGDDDVGYDHSENEPQAARVVVDEM